MKYRRHHNNTGQHTIRTGGTRRQVEAMARRILRKGDVNAPLPETPLAVGRQLVGESTAAPSPHTPDTPAPRTGAPETAA
jgi:hypothetical protein